MPSAVTLRDARVGTRTISTARLWICVVPSAAGYWASSVKLRPVRPSATRNRIVVLVLSQLRTAVE